MLIQQLREMEAEHNSLFPLQIASVAADARGLNGLLHDLAATVDHTRDDGGASDRQPGSFAELLRSIQTDAPRVLIVLDRLDAFHATPEVLRFLPPQLPAGVRVVVSLRESVPALSVLAAHLTPCTQLDVGPVSDAEFPHFLRAALEPLQLKRLDDSGHLVQLDVATSRNAFVLQRALRQWSSLPEARQIGGRLDYFEINALLASVDGFFTEALREVAPAVASSHAPESLEMRILTLMAIGRTRLSPEQLHTLLRIGGLDVTLPKIWDAIHRLSPVLGSTDRFHYAGFCYTFERYLMNRVLGAEGERNANEQIVRWLELDRPMDYIYRIHHLPFHLHRWGRLAHVTGRNEEAARAFTKLYDLLSDVTFVRDKIAGPGLEALTEDYETALGWSPPELKLDTSKVEFWSKLTSNEEIWATLTASE